MPIKKIKLPPINQYLIPHKLNWCRYDLTVYGRVKKTIITQEINREAVLVDLIGEAYRVLDTFHNDFVRYFKVILTEDEVKSVIIDSKVDKEFIKFIYG